MNLKVRLLFLWLAFIPLGITAQGINDILRSLSSATTFSSEATVVTTPPNGDDEVVTRVALFCSPSADTRQGPVDYLIDYTMPSAGDGEGFTAVVDGRQYRWNGNTLSQLSVDDKQLNQAVAAAAPYASLLPVNIAALLSRDIASPHIRASVDTVGAHLRLTLLTMVDDSVVCARRVVTLDPLTMLPLSIETINNIDTPAENATTVTFANTGNNVVVDREMVDSRHGDIMGRFADANLRPESFIGYAMPSFSLPDERGNRFTFAPGAKTLIVITDLDAPDELVTAVNDAAAGTVEGRAVDIIYILTASSIDAVRATSGVNARCRMLLRGARLAERLGAKRFPLLMLVEGDGRVSRVAVAEQNNSIEPLVIKMLDN